MTNRRDFFIKLAIGGATLPQLARAMYEVEAGDFACPRASLDLDAYFERIYKLKRRVVSGRIMAVVPSHMIDPLQKMWGAYYDTYYAPGITPQRRRRMLALHWQKNTSPLPLP